MSDVKLKPCPFCGETPTLIHHYGSVYDADRTPLFGVVHLCNPGDGYSREEAAESWNRRSHDARLIEALEPFAKEASEVGHRIADTHRYVFATVDLSLSSFTVGDLRRARSALAQAREDGA